ncbi:MAG: aspartate-semialdehyde dehydrogenase [Acidobacteria bacterium]|nr:MAG: aspartate-semialdehyde dehydrogenase [Acidobacteriota bacterium]
MQGVRKRIDVGVLGATGMVGQQFVRQLARHPWFRPAWLAASERSEGRAYADAAPWRLSDAPPEEVRASRVDGCVPGRGPRLVFSALDATAAQDIEPAFAAAGHLVVSNARCYRMDADVPLLIPEINADHLALLDRQRRARGWRGAIVTNPNCSTVVLAMVLAPLRRFGLESVLVTTMQAVSGAGYPGVSSMDILGNVVPFIANEEEKMESETCKILGTIGDSGVTPHAVTVSAHTNRVPVIDGHTEAISIALKARPSLDEVSGALASFKGQPQALNLPTAPANPIVVSAAPDRPQPRRDVDRDGGMTITVGRVRRCPILGVKLVALGHNTIRGAAGAAVLNAELMLATGLIGED